MAKKNTLNVSKDNVVKKQLKAHIIENPMAIPITLLNTIGIDGVQYTLDKDNRMVYANNGNAAIALSFDEIKKMVQVAEVQRDV
jgi:hypothetical protein